MVRSDCLEAGSTAAIWGRPIHPVLGLFRNRLPRGHARDRFCLLGDKRPVLGALSERLSAVGIVTGTPAATARLIEFVTSVAGGCWPTAGSISSECDDATCALEHLITDDWRARHCGRRGIVPLTIAVGIFVVARLSGEIVRRNGIGRIDELGAGVTHGPAHDRRSLRPQCRRTQDDPTRSQPPEAEGADRGSSARSGMSVA